ncbi:ImcF-related family protein [uncultured Paludibaculum sp.]|uniref:ImcF-related family protein n=1 Tax=uncultured Paludibaculum sp. TaxID=1765020 RepID=UPI002AAA962E|nr:ImcF-related family protein [uncultured Paludibaculum sp.]
MRKVILITVLILLLWKALVWFLGSALGLHGGMLWGLRISLWFIGLLSAGLVIWFFWRKAKLERENEEGMEQSGGDEIANLLHEAEKRLTAARNGKATGLATTPVVLIAGEPGSAKSSVVLNSGLDPELVAGRTHQDGVVTPTRSANIWFANGVAFVEAGGALTQDKALWNRLIRGLRPARLAGIFGKGGAAPRAALVCFDAETFAQPGGVELATATARKLRLRLAALSEDLGINLPVYALFTRMDRIPGYLEYVRNLTNDEVYRALGVTLPLSAGQQSRTYGEDQTARLSYAFEGLFKQLAHYRPPLLGRESDANSLAPTYEFPREFRKMQTPLVQFLLDLCRPSQLSTGPYLRGFYFSGVRPMVVQEYRSAPEVAAPRPGQGGVPHATSIFRVGQEANRPGAQQAPMVTSRRVPQWTFVGGLFHDVMLADQLALGGSTSSTKTNTLRRLGLAFACFLCLVMTIGMIVSFVRNRALESRVLEAAKGISSAESTGADLASADALRKLDTLRNSLITLDSYKRDGSPWSFHWGLYTGDDLYQPARKVYFDRFRQLLFGQTQGSILTFLRGLPPTPGPDYNPTYDALKAYLITTAHHDKSSSSFLTPVLVKFWSENRGVDPERMKLATDQFDYYAQALQAENPYTNENDASTIETARHYLAQFGDTLRVYRAMLADAAKSGPPINYHKRFPGADAAMTDTREVQSAFTKPGWEFMKGAIKNPDRYFSGEQWVLGEQVTSKIDRAKLIEELQNKYNSDFVAEWRAFLRAASVQRYASIADASKKLTLQTGPQSPLLALIWLISQNTAVDGPAVAEVFQPAQAVVPPTSTDRYIAAPNQNYMNALLGLGTSLESIVGQPSPSEAAASQILGNASTAKLAARQLAQTFRLDPAGHVEAQIQKLLEDPITSVEGLLRGLGPAELNGKGKGLCAQMSAVWNKYPFDPNATAEATLAEVNGLLHRPDGALWAFYDSSLQKVLTKQGLQYVPNPSGGINVNPAFVAFFNQASALTDALYAGDSKDPHVAFTLKPVPSEGVQSLSLRLDGQAATFGANDSTPKRFTWQGTGPHEARAGARFGGDVTWFDRDGLWAPFHFFTEAEQFQPSGSGYSVSWIIRAGKEAMKLPNGKPLTVRFDLNMEGAPPVFMKGYWRGLRCVGEVAK